AKGLPAGVVRELGHPGSGVRASGQARPSAGSGSSARTARKAGSARTRAQLLSLPAPGPRALLAAATAARPSTWSLFSGLIILLAGVTLTGSGLALARRRRGTSP